MSCTSMSQFTAGLLPVRRRRHDELMNALTGEEGSDPAALFGTPQQPNPLTGDCLHCWCMCLCRAACLTVSINDTSVT